MRCDPPSKPRPRFVVLSPCVDRAAGGKLMNVTSGAIRGWMVLAVADTAADARGLAHDFLTYVRAVGVPQESPPQTHALNKRDRDVNHVREQEFSKCRLKASVFTLAFSFPSLREKFTQFRPQRERTLGDRCRFLFVNYCSLIVVRRNAPHLKSPRDETPKQARGLSSIRSSCSDIAFRAGTTQNGSRSG